MTMTNYQKAQNLLENREKITEELKTMSRGTYLALAQIRATLAVADAVNDLTAQWGAKWKRLPEEAD